MDIYIYKDIYNILYREDFKKCVSQAEAVIIMFMASVGFYS